MTTFRNTLMATSILAGLAIFAFDAAQAGPNGPSFGGGMSSISGFSSMRVDVNRIGGPNRALSRNDTRVVPVEIRKTEKTAKSAKSAKSSASKGINTTRVSNPKPAAGGKGKEDVAAAKLRIPAPLADIYDVTGGNLGDISKFAELANWIKTGPLALGGPLFPANGDGSFVLPEALGADGTLAGGGQQQGDKNADRYWGINGWAGHRGAPQPFGNPNGKVSNDFGEVTRYPDDSSSVLVNHPNGRDYTVTGFGPLRRGANGTATVSREETRTTSRDGHITRHATRTVHYDIDDPAVNGGFKDDGPRNYAEPGERTRGPRNSTRGENEDQITEGSDEETSGGENPEDSQPVAEGTGRPGRTGWCSPTGGCVTGSVVQGPRIIPASDAQTPEMRSQLPSWATDPCPDCTTGGGGGGYSGYNPQNEGDGDIDGEGEPVGPL